MSPTSQHEIRARYETWAIATLICVALGAVAAHIDGKQDADNAAQRKVSAQRARDAAQQAEWGKLERRAKQMVNYAGIK